MTDGPPLDDALEPLAFLLGTWKGKGAGYYPTIEDFEYLEVASYSHVGKPFIAYVQRTRDASDGSPLHSETGYLRPVEDGRAEFIIAQPSGIVEMLDVEINGTELLMTSTDVFRTPTAKSVEAVRRQISVARDQMTYALQMAAVGESMSPHLEAVLTRG